MKNPTPQPPPPVPAPLWAKFTPALAAWCLLQCASTTLAASTLIFSDGFSAYPTGVCFPDGTRFGPWRSVYNGYGCNELRIVNSNHVAQISPLAATQPGRTQAGLITGPSFTGDIQVTMNVYTAKQLRTGSPPNPWEVGWVIWNHTDDTHFYYFIPKPNGWELGKEDPAYPGAQRFLATGATPVFPINKWYRVKIRQLANVISVSVNDVLLTRFQDTQRPYKSGRIALYAEDARVYYDNVTVAIP